MFPLDCGATRPTTRVGGRAVDRMQRMVERDKNHPSIILWSLGNEAARANWRRWRLGPRRDPRGRSTTSATGRAATSTCTRGCTPARGGRAIGRGAEAAGGRGEGRAAAAECRSCCASTPTRWATVPAGWRSTRSSSSATRAARAGSSGSGSTTGCATPARGFYAYGGDFGEPLHDGNFVADGCCSPTARRRRADRAQEGLRAVRIAGGSTAAADREPPRLPRPRAPRVRVEAGGGGCRRWRAGRCASGRCRPGGGRSSR